MQILANGSSDNSRRDVDVLIVNYKTPKLTICAVESVLDEPELQAAIVVDNASGDDSADRIEAHFAGRDCVRIVRSERNAGFGAGNNLAAKRASATYLFLLNSDATVGRGSLKQLRLVLESRPDVGLVAPAVYNSGEDRLQNATFGSFPTPATILLRKNVCASETLTPDWISGVAIMTRREQYEQVGGFDEGFFMYHEDVDLCRRYRQIGLSAYREMGARVDHRVGASATSTKSQLAAYDEAQDRYLAVSGVSLPARAGVRAARAIYRRLKQG